MAQQQKATAPSSALPETQFGKETGIDPKQISNALNQFIILQKELNRVILPINKGGVPNDFAVTKHTELFDILYAVTTFALNIQNPTASEQKPPEEPIKKLTVKLAMKLPKKGGKWVMDKEYFENKLGDALYALHDEDMDQNNGVSSKGMCTFVFLLYFIYRIPCFHSDNGHIIYNTIITTTVASNADGKYKSPSVQESGMHRIARRPRDDSSDDDNEDSKEIKVNSNESGRNSDGIRFCFCFHIRLSLLIYTL